MPRSRDFYVTPELGDGDPGDILRAEPMNAYLFPRLRMRARAWRIVYRSTSATGEPTAVSGTVLLPPRRPSRGPMPLIGYAIGTHGIGDHAAPSRLLARGYEYEAGPIASVLARGWAVALTDYEGLGMPGDHVYCVGRALGPNVLDAMRAARALCPDELPADGPAAIIGYSEGGHAAGWAGELQPTYAPDVPVAGIVLGAAPSNPEHGGRRLSGSVFSFFIGYGAIGYAAAYPELELDRYLTPRGHKAIEFLRRSSILEAFVRGPHRVRAEDLSEPNVMELPEWLVRLRENRLGSNAPAAPVLLYHSRRDQIVPFSQSRDLLEDYQRMGADVRLHVTRTGVDHITGMIAGLPGATRWLAPRLADWAGVPAEEYLPPEEEQAA